MQTLTWQKTSRGACNSAHHVHGLRMVREEVHDTPALLDVIPGIGLEGMHHVRELHAVTHKEDREIVAYNDSSGSAAAVAFSSAMSDPDSQELPDCRCRCHVVTGASWWSCTQIAEVCTARNDIGMMPEVQAHQHWMCVYQLFIVAPFSLILNG